MGNEIYSLFNVHVEFSQEHLFFPRIITVLLIGLLLLALFRNREKLIPALAKGVNAVSGNSDNFDRIRVFGTIVLITAYFYLMYVVGGLFPNEGYGFLLTSVPFVFLCSLLYVDSIGARKAIIISINAIIAPILIWLLFEKLLGITLP